MPTLDVDKIGSNEKDRIVVYAPHGTKEQIEELRRVRGLRSITAAAAFAFKECFRAEGI